MAHSKVAPEPVAEEEDAKVLSSTRLEDQEKRHEVFMARYTKWPYQNVAEVFMSGLRISTTQPCLGSRTDLKAPYTWLSYQEVLAQARCIGAFLTGTLELIKGTFVAVWSKNRAEWVTLELGCFLYGLVPVPLYDTLGDEACEYILRQTKATVMMCEGAQQMKGLLRLKGCNQLLHLIVIATETVDAPSSTRVWTWAEALRTGKEHQQHLVGFDPPGRDDLAVLCYTSGTTGQPKGVQITHGNLLSEVLGMHEFLVAYGSSNFDVPNHDDVYLSYLPLAHILERVVQLYCFMQGIRVGFYRGDILTLTEDMRELKPTVFCTVPRLLNRIHDTARASVSESCLKSMIFNLALRKKTEEINRGVIRNNSFWDSLVFSKVREPTGGRIRIVLVGSAPLAESVLQFTRAAFGCPVMEGYGQSEATGGSTCTTPGCGTTGHVGVPIFPNVVGLQDVPDLGYYVKDGRGEVCIRGANVTSGYYAQPDKTAEAIDSAGWLHTGDVGEWTPDGFLRIIDRKKHLFKLSQGEYIAPEKIEQVYAICTSVLQVYVDGDSIESFPLAVVVPKPNATLDWAKKTGQDGDEATAMAAACKSDQFKRHVMQEMLAAGRTAGLKSFEQVKDIFLHSEAFSVTNGLLTPTFKAKRPELKKLFLGDFKKMYQKLKTSS